MAHNMAHGRIPFPVIKQVQAATQLKKSEAISLLRAHHSDPTEAIHFFNNNLRSEPPQEDNPDENPSKPTTWDFRLPRLPAPEFLTNGNNIRTDDFSPAELAGAIQNGQDYESIRNNLTSYHRDAVEENINLEVAGFPAIFYVVETRDTGLLRFWAKHGGDVHAADGSSGVPLLAFAVAHGGSFSRDTTDIVASLLSLGASAEVIPKAFYAPYTRDLRQPDGPSDVDMPELKEPSMSWCTRPVRSALALRLNVRQRYYLYLATTLDPPGPRARQVMSFVEADALFGIPYFMIGQTLATQSLIRTMLMHLSKPEDEVEPLVLVFCGPSGHGKTELARKLGDLVSLDFIPVDCTAMRHETDMFGPRNPFHGYDKPAELNKFLVQHNGRRCLVFLDEFEKTTTEVRQALFIPFDNGEYQDRARRDSSVVCCKKAIWILATNVFDQTIHDFCEKNKAVLFDVAGRRAEAMSLVDDLCDTLRTESLGKLSEPLTGRITEFIPFLTFSEGERAIVAHKYLTEVGKSKIRPVCLTHEVAKQRFVGKVELQVSSLRDYAVCRVMAKSYNRFIGARSVKSGVRRLVEKPVSDLYYDEAHAEVTEDQDVVAYRVDVDVEDKIKVLRLSV